jgi:hypothetical protein
MDDILKKLIASDILSEETKNEITEGFALAVDEMRVSLREEIEAEVKTQLVQEWTTQRNALVESIDEMVTAALVEELEELKADISDFRDLEVEFADRLVEEKKAMAVTLSEEIDTLVDKLNEWLELRIESEFDELREDINEAKQNLFGRKIFESYAKEYTKNFVDEDSLQAQVNVLEDKLSDAEKKIVESKKTAETSLTETLAKLATLTREKALLETLAPLSGTKREQMAILLTNIETEKLSEAYAMYINRILKEDKAPVKLEESKVEEVKTEIKTGDELLVEEKKEEQKAPVDIDASAQARIRRLAGM